MMLWSSVSKPVSLVLRGWTITPAFGQPNYGGDQTRTRWRD
jgi:hypothetical protein